MPPRQPARVERHLSVGSTNALALARFAGGDPGPLWIVAERQTEGRGRRGRIWASEPGNLYASHLSLAPAVGIMGLMPLAAALALAEALESVGVATGRIALKWPNDVLVDGCKIGGILLEAETRGGVTAVVAGFGVNCRWHPDDVVYKVANLTSLGVPVGPQDLFAALGTAWTGTLARLVEPGARAWVRASWCRRAAGLGAPIVVRLERAELDGRFVDLDEDCRLILERPDGARVPIAAGDVFFAAGPGAA